VGVAVGVGVGVAVAVAVAVAGSRLCLMRPRPAWRMTARYESSNPKVNPMKIYGSAMSTCTRRVLATLAEKQASYELVELDFRKGEHKTPAHLARQPFGQMPALEDNGFTLFESRAMMRYIDEAVTGHPLTPREPKVRALMEQWISVENDDYNPAISTIVAQEMFVPMMGGKTDPAKVEEAKMKLKSVVAVLDKHLAKGPHFVGDQFTLADITYLPYTEYAMNTSAKDILLGHAGFAAWWTRVSERASWRKVTGK
jgi:glutathione S-transferase